MREEARSIKRRHYSLTVALSALVASASLGKARAKRKRVNSEASGATVANLSTVVRLDVSSELTSFA